MYKVVTWILDALTRVEWLDILKTVGTLATAVIAYLALRNWQRQDRATREAEFLDALIETVHAYVVELGRPIALVESVRIGMKSQTSAWNDDDESVAIEKGAILYIKKEGAEAAKRLLVALDEVRPASIRLRSLGTKGQVFSFKDYAKCHDALALLIWQFDRMEAFATIVGSPTLNWENPEVKRTLLNVLTVAPKDIRKHIAENNLTVLN